MNGRRMEMRGWGFAVYMTQKVPTKENCVTVGLFWKKRNKKQHTWAMFSSHSPFAALHFNDLSPLDAAETRTIWCLTDRAVEMSGLLFCCLFLFVLFCNSWITWEETWWCEGSACRTAHPQACSDNTCQLADSNSTSDQLSWRVWWFSHVDDVDVLVVTVL